MPVIEPGDTWPATCRFCGFSEILDDWGDWVPAHITEDSLDADYVDEPVCPPCTDRYLRYWEDSHGRTFTGLTGEVFPKRHSEYVLRCPAAVHPGRDALLDRLDAAVRALRTGPATDRETQLARIEVAIDALRDVVRHGKTET